MDLSLEKLEEAVSLRRKIDALEKKLASLFRNSSSKSSANKRRKRLSGFKSRKERSAARARQTAFEVDQEKGGITPSGRKKLSRLMKARWAARRKTAAGDK